MNKWITLINSWIALDQMLKKNSFVSQLLNVWKKFEDKIIITPFVTNLKFNV